MGKCLDSGASFGPGSHAPHHAPTDRGPTGVDPSRNDAAKAYLLGRLDERKDICRYLDVRAVRGANHWHSLPWWAFIRRKKALWALTNASIAAKEIEQAEHVTDQAVWVVEINDGVIVGRDAFIRDRDRSGEADETRNAAQPEARARAEGIAQPSPEASS